MPRGRLITVEGIDGAGKSTLVAGLVAARPTLTALREPGGVALSERVRALVHDPELRVEARAEALLYAAARAQLVAERLRPLLDAGGDVVLDRFVDSSLVYQGAGRGLGMETVERLNWFATDGLTPDLSFLLRIEVATARARQDAERDRMEREGDDFFATIARAYDELAAAHPDRFVVLDASEPADALLAKALAQL